MRRTWIPRLSCVALAVVLTACGSGGSTQPGDAKGSANPTASPTKGVPDEFAGFCDTFDAAKVGTLVGQVFDTKGYSISGRGTATCALSGTVANDGKALRVGISRAASDASKPKADEVYGKPQAVKGIGDHATVVVSEFAKGSASAGLTFDVGDDRWYVSQSSSGKLSKAAARAGAEAVAKYVIPLIGDAMTFSMSQIRDSKANPANFIKMTAAEVSAATRMKVTQDRVGVYWSSTFGSLGWIDKQKSQPLTMSYTTGRGIDEARVAAEQPNYEGKKAKIATVAGLGDKAFVASQSYGTGMSKQRTHSVYFQLDDELWTVYVTAGKGVDSPKAAIALATALKESL